MLRFLADFLYISADKENVERFITTMYKGNNYKATIYLTLNGVVILLSILFLDHPCAVNKEKSLTNFDIIVNRKPIKKLSNTFGKSNIL